MADELSLVLYSLAEYFNYFAVVLILLCSVLMTVFIVRHGEHLGLYRGRPGEEASSLAYQKPVTEFCNPFVLKLSTHSASVLQDHLRFDVSCLVPCEVAVYWGVSINPVHAALLKTGVAFLDGLFSNSLLQGDCLIKEKYRLEAPGKHKLQLLIPTSFKPELLGPPPRQRYPCVIIMAAPDRERNNEEESEVVALVTVMHVKDNQCRMDTHIMAQYAKLAGRAVYNLQPLFFATEVDNDGSISPTESEQHGNGQVGDNLQHFFANQAPADCEMNSDISNEGGEPLSDSRQHGKTAGNRSSTSLSCKLEASGGCLMSENSEQYSASQSSGCSEEDGPRRRRDVPHVPPASATNSARGDSDTGHSDPKMSEFGDLSLPDCIVCQNQRLTCVLLPCRHVCVCRSCFLQLDRCPMCRSHIESFFTLTGGDDNDDDGSDNQDSEVQEPRDWATKWEMLNQRLNDLLGFT